jgi:hypothetical protein
VPAALRIGSYGDPAAVPTWVWKDLASDVKVMTGYTHQWKRFDQALKLLMMASARPVSTTLRHLAHEFTDVSPLFGRPPDAAC